MVLRDGSSLNTKGLAPKPPITAGRSPRPSTNGTREQALDKIIDSLRNAIAEIIKNTEWPEDSKEAAKGLTDTIESSPDIPNSTIEITEDIQDLIKKYTQALEDVHLRLKDASSKSGIKNWKIYQTLRSMASKRPSKCTLLFQTCQADVSQAANSLRVRMESEGGKEIGSDVFETPLNAHHSGVPPENAQSGSAEHAIASASSTTPAQNSLSPGREDEEPPNPIRREALVIARKTFKAVEIASGSIPVAGTYVAAAAKVGLAFVETIQTMDKNDDLAKDLGAQTTKLSKLLAGVTEPGTANQGELIADEIADLQRELRHVYDKVQEWKSLGRFNKAFHSRDHGETLKKFEGTIHTALEELQLLVGLDSRNMLVELRNIEIQEQRQRLLDRLGDGNYGAQGSAIADVICFPGTRVKILERIDSWIRDMSTIPDRVLWIRGMAGRGKSTIASTVVHSWKYRASCAIFHFRRGQNTVNTRFVCTLAKRLGSSLVPEVKNGVLESVRENRDIANERLEEQFKTLFVGPLSKLEGRSHPVLIVIDALDEYDNTKDAIHFVRLIDRHSQSFPANVKFLLTCRPEAQLIRTLGPGGWHSEDLDAAADVSEDLERFIQQAFKQIKDSDPDVPENWPSSAEVQRLVDMSQGLFQWARTAITYVGDGSPVDRLRVLLKRPSMWSGLDDLYHQILSKAFENVRLDLTRQDVLCRVLGTLIVAPYPVSLSVIASLYCNHEMFEGTSQEYIVQFLRKDILADLTSLLSIPTSPADPMHLMHTSIRDLLASKNRCDQRSYYIDPNRHHRQLAKLCLEIMLVNLKEDVCNLMGASKPSPEVKGIVEKEISKALRYSCRSWSIHLMEGINRTEMNADTAAVSLGSFELFSKEKLMSWLEVMSFIGATSEAIGIARRIYHRLLQRPSEQCESDSLTMLWGDVQRFITTFWEPISFGPAHIYISSLPHCPVETELWKLYGKYAKVRTVRGVKSSTWPASLWARSTSGIVMTAVFSPDGKTVASGSSDGIIRLWDPETGTTVNEPLTSHRGGIHSVCFSPDGKVLASGSDDRTIRLWDSQTGAAVGEPLIGHDESVRSVCFSPSGKILASGSNDQTVRLWDPDTGTAVGEPLTGHIGYVTSIHFSPDGKILASSSSDRTFRLWDLQARVQIGAPITGHASSVYSVCFSPNGKVLASGSTDRAVRLWDPQTGAAIGEPLEGHNREINHVCFSPDGKLLASGSDDGTIRLWDPRTGDAVGQPLMGHNDLVRSVCFSPDGKLLASGSDDHTIRLWNPQTGVVDGEPLAGKDVNVTYVRFSPDGKVLAYGSKTGTIRLWDSRTGMPIGEPLEGHDDEISSLCFSPDGKVLASGSDDSTIHLWDPQTGAAVGEPLTGHANGVNFVCFSPSGKIMASGSGDSTVRLWDPDTGIAVGQPLTGHSDRVRSVCFSPDGNVLASSSNDRTIRLWDPQTGTPVGEPLTGHSRYVRSVCFSPDGKLLASGSDDRTLRLWDPQSGTPVGEPLRGHIAEVTSVRFSADGTLLMAQYLDGFSETWDVITLQRCSTPRTLLSDSNPGYRDHWVTLFSSPFFWLPTQYWGFYECLIILSGGTLAVLQHGTLSIFDVSRVVG